MIIISDLNHLEIISDSQTSKIAGGYGFFWFPIDPTGEMTLHVSEKTVETDEGTFKSQTGTGITEDGVVFSFSSIISW